MSEFKELVTKINNNEIVKLEITNKQVLKEQGNLASLSKALSCNTSITSISIVNADIGDEEVEILTKALEKNSNLKHLNLKGNKISTQGASYIIKLLEANKNIVSLDLSDNGLGNEGSVLLLKFLEKNKSITSFAFSNEPIIRDILGVYLIFYPKNNLLLQALKKLLENNTTITSLTCGIMGVIDSKNKATTFANALNKNTTITSIDFLWMSIPSISISQIILKALKENPFIYNVSGIDVNDELILALNKKEELVNFSTNPNIFISKYKAERIIEVYSKLFFENNQNQNQNQKFLNASDKSLILDLDNNPEGLGVLKDKQVMGLQTSNFKKKEPFDDATIEKIKENIKENAVKIKNSLNVGSLVENLQVTACNQSLLQKK